MLNFRAMKKSVYCLLLLMSCTHAPTQSTSGSDVCSYDSLKQSDFPPHTEVRADINSDGLLDHFFLSGQEYDKRTCVWLGAKDGKPDLVHHSSTSYDTFLDLNGDGIPELLTLDSGHTWCATERLFSRLSKTKTQELVAFYNQAAKGYENFNFTYNMPDYFPLWNAYWFEPVTVYSLTPSGKADVSADMHAYNKLKKSAIIEILNSKSVAEVRKHCLDKLLQLKVKL